MSSETITRCDFCGKVKGETNHWWTLWLQEGRLVVSTYTEIGHSKDACGMQCVTQAVARFLNHRSLDDASYCAAAPRVTSA